jgi:hypothetical protein
MSERDWNKALAEDAEAPKRAGDNARRWCPEDDQDNGKSNGRSNGAGTSDDTTNDETQAIRFKLESFESMEVGAERPELIKGLIPRNGIVVVWGQPKCGKSFWTADAMMHVALGWPYRDRKVQQGTVVYCNFEGNAGVPGASKPSADDS